MHELALEAFLPYRLNRLAAALSQQLSEIYRSRHGLSRPQWRVLATLGQFEAMTARDIVAHSAMHKTKVSRAVAALEKRRWLQRRPDEQDRRFEQLSLTPAGRAAYGDLAPLMLDFETTLLAALPPATASALQASLADLETVLGLD